MRKAKYFFDPQTLSYREAKRGFKYYFWRGLGVLTTSLGLALGLFIFFSGVIDSPKERVLKKQNRDLKEQLSLIEKQVAFMDSELQRLVQKDDEIYRTIFEAEPLSDRARRAGIGGVNRYEELRKLKGGAFLVALREKLDHLEARIKVQDQSFDEVLTMAENKRNLLAAIPSIQPVANKDLKRVASGYGIRIDPFYRTKKFHSGLDFSAPRGTPVYATADGKVIKVKSEIWGYGKHLVIDHGFGYKTVYAHLHKFEVKQGQQVTRGQLIGRVGNTGKSTAPHLHYEVRIQGQPVNPAYFFHNDLSDEEFKKVLEMASQPNQTFD